jgi:Tol biopolymer transport system component
MKSDEFITKGMKLKQKTVFVGIVVLSVFIFYNCTQQSDFPVLKGPYLGQKPPGMIPEVFAPNIISTAFNEFKIVFSPDGKELFYQLWGAPIPVILTMEEKDGRWSKPKVAPFSGQVIEGFDITPDGEKIVIGSQRPMEGGNKPAERYNHWIIEKSDSGWGKPKHIKTSIQGYPTIAQSGNLYLGDRDLWMAKYVDGEYKKEVILRGEINSVEFSETDPFIAPDESYILFCRRNDGFGSWDIFVSYQKKDGSWTKGINLGEPINSMYSDVYPFVTTDGKYLFFSSSRTTHKDFYLAPITYEEKMACLNNPGNGNQDIYWVNAAIIEKLKPIEFK